MNRKIRNRIPVFRKGEKKDHDFRKKDKQAKMRQKKNFDLRHRVNILPNLKPGQPVWIKTPKTTEAIVLPTPDTRMSVNVETETGFTRRNRSHLRLRDPTTKSRPSHPREKPLLIHNRKENVQVELENIPFPNDIPVVQPENSSSQETVDPTPRRSGRIPKPVQKLDL